jgi:predicted methyltransferase MtxX (methanogen marker protein 4)
MSDDLVERVVDAMLRARVSGGGVEHDARAAIAIALEEAAKVAEADAKKSGWLVAAQLGLTEDEQKQFNQSAAKALEIAAAIRAMIKD